MIKGTSIAWGYHQIDQNGIPVLRVKMREKKTEPKDFVYQLGTLNQQNQNFDGYFMSWVGDQTDRTFIEKPSEEATSRKALFNKNGEIIELGAYSGVELKPPYIQFIKGGAIFYYPTRQGRFIQSEEDLAKGFEKKTGTLFDQNGGVYVGELLIKEIEEAFLYEINGEGEYFTISDKGEEAILKGNFEKGLLKGTGELITSDLYYDGNFENGNFSGEGVLTNHNLLQKLEGFFENNQLKSGKISSLKEKNTYIECPDFKNGEANGQTISNSPHERYEGGMKDGLKEGKGTLYYSDIIIEAFFTKDIATKDIKLQLNNGQIVTFPDMKSNDLRQMLTNNQDLIVKLDMPDGRGYKGQVKNFIPHGEGTLWNPDGLEMKGKFVDGRLRGEVISNNNDFLLKAIINDNEDLEEGGLLFLDIKSGLKNFEVDQNTKIEILNQLEISGTKAEHPDILSYEDFKKLILKFVPDKENDINEILQKWPNKEKFRNFYYGQLELKQDDFNPQSIVNGFAMSVNMYGDAYFGNFLNDKYHGAGTLYTRDKKMITGEFKKGELIKILEVVEENDDDDNDPNNGSGSAKRNKSNSKSLKSEDITFDKINKFNFFSKKSYKHVNLKPNFIHFGHHFQRPTINFNLLNPQLSSLGYFNIKNTNLRNFFSKNFKKIKFK